MRVVRLVPVLLVIACGDHHDNPDAAIDSTTDAPVDMMVDANPFSPPTLFDTGLCVDKACTQIASGITTYTPRFPLWSDSASKRRWMYLPPGTQIDTSDMDHWVFPVGTKFWKEFTRDGVRVETRLIWHISETGTPKNDWFYVAYQWNATEDDTMAVPLGVTDANGTMHDIPSRTQCKGCHERLLPNRILGFQAIQLDYDNTTAGEVDFADLVANGTLTQNPANATPPYYPFDATAAQGTIAAAGYVHANCGHCHNPTSDVYMNITPMVLRLTVASLDTTLNWPVYQTAVNHDAASPIDGLTKIIQPGDPTHSIMIDRFESTNVTVHMPALGSEMMDPTGDTTLRDWITGLM
jgi:hypothetical protein